MRRGAKASNRIQTATARTIENGSSVARAYDLEEMITCIRNNPDAALSTHLYLMQRMQDRNQNTPVESSTPLTTERNRDSSSNNSPEVT